MLINDQLPINSDRLNEQDQTLRLAGMNWADFEQLISEEYLGYRVSFFNGVISLVSPSRSHEQISSIISCLINAYCREFSLSYYAMGSTTLKHEPLVGKEPDVSYSFETDKNIPDLAIEVVLSSGSIEDLAKYKILGVPEVWFWQDQKLTFYQLQSNGYKQVSSSIFLPKLTAKGLVLFVNQAISESTLRIETEFSNSLKTNC